MKQLIVTIEDKKWLSPSRSARFAEMSLSELQKQNVAQESAGLKNAGTKRKSHISQERLREVLDYNPDTGVFTWVNGNSRNVKSGDIAGYKNQQGYIRIRVGAKLLPAHRLAWIYVYGEDIDGYEIDHINGDKSDNRICNLRISSHQQNMFNMKKKSTNKSGVKGVHFDKRCNKWRAQTSINKKRVHLGLFNTIESAEEAISEFMVANHKEFINLG